MIVFQSKASGRYIEENIISYPRKYHFLNERSNYQHFVLWGCSKFVEIIKCIDYKPKPRELMSKIIIFIFHIIFMGMFDILQGNGSTLYRKLNFNGNILINFLCRRSNFYNSFVGSTRHLTCTRLNNFVRGLSRYFVYGVPHHNTFVGHKKIDASTCSYSNHFKFVYYSESDWGRDMIIKTEKVVMFSLREILLSR